MNSFLFCTNYILFTQTSINVENVLLATTQSYTVPLHFAILFEDVGRSVGKGHFSLLRNLSKVLTFHFTNCNSSNV